MKLCPSYVIVFLCVFSLWHIAINAKGVELSRGRQILLDRGLQIQGLAFRCNSLPIDYDRWNATNFTTLNAWNSSSQIVYETPVGTPWGRVYEDNWWEMPSDPALLDNLVSLQYWDEREPDATFTNNSKARFKDWQTMYPNTLAYTNFYGHQIDATELATYMQAAEPDMVMFDTYPPFDFPTPNRNMWYSYMQKYRTAGLAGNDGTGQQPIPYGQFLNLYRSDYTKSLPSESYVRLQQNASLAFGYTFISAFVYNDPNYSGVVSTMFSSSGDSSPTPVFDYVAEANRQSRNLGPALVRLVSTDIQMIPSKNPWGYNTVPSGISAWSSGTADTGGYTDYITSVQPTGWQGGVNDTTYSDILVGYFEPLLADNSGCTFANGLHFMIVNGATGTSTAYNAPGDPASASEQWYRISFDFIGSDYDSLVRLSRDTGEVELVELTHTVNSAYYFDLNLPGGTGDLFAYWDSSNPLPTIPEPGAIIMLFTGLMGLMAYARWNRRQA